MVLVYTNLRSVDVLGPYPVTPRDNKYVLIVEDLFTKCTEAKPASNSEAATICQFLEDEIFARYGDPKVVISDNATVFQSQKYLNMCQRKQIQPYHTAIYFQRENPVERKVADFKTILRALMYIQQRRRNWDQQVPRALAIQRRRKNRATGESPATALLGYEAAAQGGWEIPEFQRRRKRPREVARLRRQTIIARQLDFNQNTYPGRDDEPTITFQVGDMVMVKEHNPPDPFAPTWAGPFPIAVRNSPQIYEVDKYGRQFKYHVDQFRPAPPGNPPLEEDDSSDEEDDDDNAQHPNKLQSPQKYTPPHQLQSNSVSARYQAKMETVADTKSLTVSHSTKSKSSKPKVHSTKGGRCCIISNARNSAPRRALYAEPKAITNIFHDVSNTEAEAAVRGESKNFTYVSNPNLKVQHRAPSPISNIGL
ncbi:uncharacterized protein K02A2.6-like [Anoplophora glabripennis]|uniref:uncharacterized protein K02A2.6-like n=1 Tax=Anoplophora glabripennis TaxID=217634 RepID=UPI00087433F0|nr:uncharacterized protein K02A2.6-like [Anoplophora glabripennis]